VAPESIQAESCFPPPPRVVALPTAATEKWLARPVLLHGLTARQVLSAVIKEHYDATRERRMFIEGTLERLEDLRQRLIAKLDALDADPDLEPCLGAMERWDQRKWARTGDDDREDDPADEEPNLSATNHIDQRAWSMGGATELEWEHDGKEPDCSEACPWPDEGDQSRFPGAPA
jgi:hypothetical protein